ncbi:MAG: CPBP family intramembrane metalloprotease [Gemmataceae bacterium]|nr:CPBP family intramembrane metalloprotease [Gemmataceae bacterium]
MCEEIAFRGFVLRGLHHGFRQRNAVLLSSFFFGLIHMDVFPFAPTLLFGVVLGLLTMRSLMPAICFHLLHNTVLIAMIPLSRFSEDRLPVQHYDLELWLVGGCAVASATLVWWLYRKPYAELECQQSGSLHR